MERRKQVYAASNAPSSSKTEAEHMNTALSTLFLIASPREIYRTMPEDLLMEFDGYRHLDNMSELLRSEVVRLGDQLNSLMNDYCNCQNKQRAMARLPGVMIRK
jgi:glutathione gamma-glutamylcysteinyltransferase